MIKNVESNTKTDFPSDHVPVEAKIKIKLAKHRGRPPDKSNEWKSPIKPDEENLIKFNTDFINHYREWTVEHESTNKAELNQKVEAFQFAILESAKTNVEKKPANNQTVVRSAELENLFTERKN
jgi:hypothetical protein